MSILSKLCINKCYKKNIFIQVISGSFFKNIISQDTQKPLIEVQICLENKLLFRVKMRILDCCTVFSLLMEVQLNNVKKKLFQLKLIYLLTSYIMYLLA